MKIDNIDLNEKSKKDFTEFSLMTIIDRALPSVHDGVKPVQRRILYGMHKIGAKNHMKSAKITGFIMGEQNSFNKKIWFIKEFRRPR